MLPEILINAGNHSVVINGLQVFPAMFVIQPTNRGGGLMRAGVYARC